MFHNISGSPKTPTSFPGQDTTQRTSTDQKSNHDATTTSSGTSRSEHPMYRSRGPSSLQQQAISQVNSTSPSSSSASQGSHDASFQTLLSAAEATVRKLQTKQPEERTIERAQNYAYLNYIYFPHQLKHVDRMAKQRTVEQNRDAIVNLGHLADEHAGSVAIVAQSYYQRGYAVSPREALEIAEASPSPEKEKLMEKVFSDNYVFLPPGWETRVEEEDSIDSRVSINVTPKYAPFLPEVFVDLCKNNPTEVSQCKLFGPKYWGVRSETGACYLPKPDWENAKHVRKLIHELLIKKLGREVSMDELYASPPPGTQRIYPDYPGGNYSENAPGSNKDESSGDVRARIVAFAAIEHLETGKDLAIALKENLEKSGHLAGNPAFVVWPGEDSQSAQDRVSALLNTI